MQALSFRLELQPREGGANMKLFPAVEFIKQARSVTSAYILYKISKHDLIFECNFTEHEALQTQTDHHDLGQSRFIAYRKCIQVAWLQQL